MIQIPEQKIIKAAEKGMDEFLKVFTDAYLEVLDGGITAENMHKLNGYQHTLLAFRFFTDEVREGGFVQLIQNGYGGYLFDNPAAKALKSMGAKGLSKILYTEEEFMAMYEQFEQFDELEEKYMEIEEEETSVIAAYVDENMEDFAEVVK